MTEETNRIDIAEFRDKGFLQEVNRQFFHPLGLALEVMIDIKGVTKLGGIWDYRDDPEGLFFGDEMLEEEKINYVEDLKNSKRVPRLLAVREYKLAINKDSIQIKV